jgi:hypothetical protein
LLGNWLYLLYSAGCESGSTFKPDQPGGKGKPPIDEESVGGFALYICYSSEGARCKTDNKQGQKNNF